MREITKARLIIVLLGVIGFNLITFLSFYITDSLAWFPEAKYVLHGAVTILGTLLYFGIEEKEVSTKR